MSAAAPWLTVIGLGEDGLDALPAALAELGAKSVAEIVGTLRT